MQVDRYLLREVSVPFIGVSSALLVIFLTYSMTVFLAKATSGLFNPSEVAYLTFLKSIIALEVLLPLGMYLGVILGMGRLYSDSEMYALQAAGYTMSTTSTRRYPITGCRSVTTASPIYTTFPS